MVGGVEGDADVAKMMEMLDQKWFHISSSENCVFFISGTNEANKRCRDTSTHGGLNLLKKTTHKAWH